jgi:hypothetical protein
MHNYQNPVVWVIIVFRHPKMPAEHINPMESYLNAYSVDSEIRFKSPNMAMMTETHKKSYKINHV